MKVTRNPTWSTWTNENRPTAIYTIVGCLIAIKDTPTECDPVRPFSTGEVTIVQRHAYSTAGIATVTSKVTMFKEEAVIREIEGVNEDCTPMASLTVLLVKVLLQK